MTPATVSHFNSTPFYLAVRGGALIQSASFQYQSAVETHSSAPEVSRGHCSGVAAASVPLVNNRKGSLLRPAVGSRDPNQAGQQPGAPEEAGRLQRTRSLPDITPVTPVTPHSVTGTVRAASPRTPVSLCGSNRSTKACIC